jgi:hypothetical protein
MLMPICSRGCHSGITKILLGSGILKFCATKFINIYLSVAQIDSKQILRVILGKINLLII